MDRCHFPSIAKNIRRRLSASSRDQRGSVLVEVVVSAMLVSLIAVGVLGAIEAATRASAQERDRSRAHGLAQEDQARMRAMSVGDLTGYSATRSVTRDGSAYTVASKSEFLSDSTGTVTCSDGAASADYIRVTSTVTWPAIGSRPPIVLQSIVSPPAGSIGVNRGALAVRLENGQGNPITGVSLTGNGPGTFAGTTNSEGCALFGNLPEGNYTLKVGTTGLIDRNGAAPDSQTVSVVAGATNTVVLQLDEPGSINISFKANLGGATLQSVNVDSVMAFHTGMTLARQFGTIRIFKATQTATPMFPFSSPYTVYAGSCQESNPAAANPNSPGVASVSVTPNGAASATVQVPGIRIQVFDGTANKPNGPAVGATVTIVDANCSVGGNPVTRTVSTDATGTVLGVLPYGTYNLTATKGSKSVSSTGNAVQSFSSVTQLDLYLGK